MLILRHYLVWENVVCVTCVYSSSVVKGPSKVGICEGILYSGALRGGWKQLCDTYINCIFWLKISREPRQLQYKTSRHQGLMGLIRYSGCASFKDWYNVFSFLKPRGKNYLTPLDTCLVASCNLANKKLIPYSITLFTHSTLSKSL